MVSKCIKICKGGRNSGFYWLGRQGKVEDTLEASLREADRMGQNEAAGASRSIERRRQMRYKSIIPRDIPGTAPTGLLHISK